MPGIDIILCHSRRANQPDKGLLVLFDINRYIGENDHAAALMRLLVANFKSPDTRPIVVRHVHVTCQAASLSKLDSDTRAHAHACSHCKDAHPACIGFEQVPSHSALHALYQSQIGWQAEVVLRTQSFKEADA